MRDDEYRGVIAGLGDLGDVLRFEAIDAGQIGKEMLLEPSRSGLVKADMEEHVTFPAFSSQRGRDFGSVTRGEIGRYAKASPDQLKVFGFLDRDGEAGFFEMSHPPRTTTAIRILVNQDDWLLSIRRERRRGP